MRGVPSHNLSPFPKPLTPFNLLLTPSLGLEANKQTLPPGPQQKISGCILSSAKASAQAACPCANTSCRPRDPRHRCLGHCWCPLRGLPAPGVRMVRSIRLLPGACETTAPAQKPPGHLVPEKARAGAAADTEIALLSGPEGPTAKTSAGFPSLRHLPGAPSPGDSAHGQGHRAAESAGLIQRSPRTRPPLACFPAWSLFALCV